jgi:hypothetical protein
VEPPRLPFRMADFAGFGWRVATALRGAHEWEDLLRRTERAQIAFASEGDGLVETLRMLLDKESDRRLGPITVRDLYRRCQQIGQDESLPLPKDVTGFGKKLSTMKRVIEIELGVRVHEERLHARQRYVSFVSREGNKP